MFRSHRADLLEARDREVAALKLVIEALSEQIDYLRIVMGQPNLSRTKSALPFELQSPDLVEGLQAYLSEEEEDLIALRDAGHIDEQEFEQQLAAAGIRGKHLTLA
jgi:chromatin segregation and condensation protein Rec8/ScpA/Scc1 (kleisin family)